MSCRALIMAAVVAIASVGCGEVEGPAARLFLQIVRADPDLDTTDVTGFVVIVGGARHVIDFDPDAPVVLELQAPPALATPFVVYACETPNAACREGDARFVGCAVVDVVASDEGVPVRIGLSPISPLPDSCIGVDGAPPAPVG